MAAAPSITRVPVSGWLAEHSRRKIAVRLLPFLFLLYIVNYVDRTNIAYAAIGMTRDLGFSDRVFGMGAGIFFISYLALQVPGSLAVERWSARKTISASLIAWGSLTVLTALVHTPVELYLARFVLGAAEAVFFPGVIVYLSHWFIHEDRAKATSNFMGAIPLSAVLGSPLAGWILGIQWLGWKGWRWLFVVEGLPAILLGVVAFFFLTDWPRQARWLAEDQREWIEGALDQQKAVRTVSVWKALQSRMVLLFGSILVFSYFTFYSFAFWFPTILKRQSGVSDLRVGVLGAIPFLAYFLAMQVNGWHSDKSDERRWHTAIPIFLASLALLILAGGVHSLAPLLLLFTLVGIGASYVSIFWAIPAEILDRSTAVTAVGLVNAIGSFSGFLGPYTFGSLYAHTGSFSPGLLVMCACAAVSGVLILLTPKRTIGI